MWGMGNNSMLMYFLINSPFMRKGKYNEMQNNRTFLNTLEQLINFAINTFEWEGLPETVNESYFEYSLLFNGAAAIANDEQYGYIGLPYSNDSSINIYSDPASITLTGANGYNKKFVPFIRGFEDENITNTAVRCFDNRVQYPYIQYIIDAAYRITQTLRSMDVSVKKLKNPYIFIGDKTIEPDYKAYLNALEKNDDAILVTSQIDTASALTSVETGQTVDIVNALWEQYTRLLNNIQETLGVNNNPDSDKKERLLVDEVNSNNQGTNINLDIRLKTREEFCKDINQNFGLNVSVKLRHQEMIDRYDLIEDDKNDNDGADNKEVE